MAKKKTINIEQQDDSLWRHLNRQCRRVQPDPSLCPQDAKRLAFFSGVFALAHFIALQIDAMPGVRETRLAGLPATKKHMEQAGAKALCVLEQAVREIGEHREDPEE